MKLHQFREMREGWRAAGTETELMRQAFRLYYRICLCFVLSALLERQLLVHTDWFAPSLGLAMTVLWTSLAERKRWWI